MDPISKLTANKYPGTLNGFDELAIAARFGSKLFDMQEAGEPILFLRALVFVDRRRNHAASDSDAYQYAMELTIEDTGAYFPDEPKPQHMADLCRELEDGGWECAPECPARIQLDAGAQLADDMAWFVLATGVQPSEYLQLTQSQREAFVRQSQKMKDAR